MQGKKQPRRENQNWKSSLITIYYLQHPEVVQDLVLEEDRTTPVSKMTTMSSFHVDLNHRWHFG